MNNLNKQSLNISQLKDNPASFLALGVDDPTLLKLESYRLYRAGYQVTEIAEALSFSRSYLYQIWKKFETEGTVGLVNKHWGSAPRKRTKEREAAVLRAKALNPYRSDRDLANEFDMDRSTVYCLLKEHGLQDLHQVLVGTNSNPIQSQPTFEIEAVECKQVLLLTLLPALRRTGALSALSCLQTPINTFYSDDQLHLSLLLLSAWGVLRLSHVNDQPVNEWGLLLDHSRRPDGDTLDRYLKQLIELDEVGCSQSVIERQGQIRPRGLIEQAQLSSLRLWAEAGLMDDDIWHFDAHVIEYTGKVPIGKTKHGTKSRAVKAIKRFTIHNGLCVLDYYCPTHISYAEAMKHLVTLANQALPDGQKIRFLSFDREGWDRQLLNWLENEAKIVPVTWVKRTTKIVKQLAQLPEISFCEVDDELKVGKKNPERIKRIADSIIELSDWGAQRVIVLETQKGKRLAIYTTAEALDNVNQAFTDYQSADSIEIYVDSSLIDAHQDSSQFSNTSKDLKSAPVDLQTAAPAANQTQITQQTADPAANQTQITQQTTDSAANQTQIVLQTDAPAPNQTQIARQTTDSAANQTQIVLQTDAPAPNQTQIALQTTDSAANQTQIVLQTDTPTPNQTQIALQTVALTQNQTVVALQTTVPTSNQTQIAFVNQLASNQVPLTSQTTAPTSDQITQVNQPALNQISVATENNSKTPPKSAQELLDAMRFKQRLENEFKVEVHEMNGDAIPSQKSYSSPVSSSFDTQEAQHKLELAEKRIKKYEALEENENQLYETGQINKHQLNHMRKRTLRLKNKAEKEVENYKAQLAAVEKDENGQDVLVQNVEVLDVRKMTLLNLFKRHALVILKMLAAMLGIPEAGPLRLRRSFLPFGQLVEFDHSRRTATVVAAPMSRATMRQAYARLCEQLNADPPTLTRQGVTYQVYFK